MAVGKGDVTRPGPFPRLSDPARAASLAATMAAAPVAGQVWVFAYGSLIWDPCFAYAERRVGALAGYRRSFCFWSISARGSPERPGLGMALVEGADRCHGLVYRLAPAELEAGLDALWAREMAGGVYRPVWLPVATGDGDVQAIVFTAEQTHDQFAGPLSVDETAAHIAAASGTRGPCRDYLARVVDNLATLGLRDAALDDLRRRVDAHR